MTEEWLAEECRKCQNRNRRGQECPCYLPEAQNLPESQMVEEESRLVTIQPLGQESPELLLGWHLGEVQTQEFVLLELFQQGELAVVDCC